MTRALFDVQYDEMGQASRVASTPMSHLSIEVGHLYMEDFADGRGRIVEMARQVMPWVRAAQESFMVTRAGTGWKGKPRVSTCFLIDDYFAPFSNPGELIPMIVDAYREVGLTIDYIAREAGCAQAGDVPIAEVVRDWIVPDPPPDTDGSRPTVAESGWLANGKHSREISPEAMALDFAWQPPVQNAVNRHSVFIDVQLWDMVAGVDGQEPRWSCPFLAAVWQLMRLGVLRFDGRPVVEPVPFASADTSSWSAFPALVQITDGRVQPFTAYSTFSALSTQFLGIEHAVRTILGQVQIPPEVEKQVVDRIEAEHLSLPKERLIDRVDYAFLGPPVR